MSNFRYVLQGCNEANVASAWEAARGRIPGSAVLVERSSKGYYFISVVSDADHERIRVALTEALMPLHVTVAIIETWVPTGFSEFS